MKAALSPAMGSGVYWNPSEPGTGFFFEIQRDKAIATFYMYEDDGRPVWYSAVGSYTNPQFPFRDVFSGTLQRFSGGQHAKSAQPRQPTSTDVGPVSITFESGKAQVRFPGRSFTAERFNGAGGGSLTRPETGIYWNPAESGRGYTVEVANGVATIGIFHYDEAGNPIWNLVVAPFGTVESDLAAGDMGSYVGGQTLGGAYRPAKSTASPGVFSARFSHPCKGQFTFPGMAPTSVQRFAFGAGLSGIECRAEYLPPVATSFVSPVSLQLAQPKALTGETFQSARLEGTFEFDVSGDIAALDRKTLYVNVHDPDGLFEDSSTAIQLDPKSTRAVIRLFGAKLGRSGRYKGELSFVVCLNPYCTVQLIGSPFRVPYDFEARPVSTSATTMTGVFKPNDFTVTVPLTLTLPPRVRVPVRFRLDGVTPARFSAPGLPTGKNSTGWDWVQVPMSEVPQQITVQYEFNRSSNSPTVTQYSIGTISIEGNAMPVGSGMGDVNTAKLFSLTLPVELRSAEADNELRPLSPMPGASAWTSAQGDVTHNAYIPFTLDPGMFARRFSMPQDGPRRVEGASSDAGVVCNQSRQAQDYAVDCFDEQTGQRLWTRPFPTVVHMPSVVGDKVIVTRGLYSNSVNGDPMFWVYEARTGKELARRSGSSWDGPLAPAMLQGGVVYLAFRYGLSAYDLTTGSTLWTVPLPAGKEAPTLANGKAYAYRSGTLHEIDLVSGQMRKLVIQKEITGASGWSSKVVISGTFAYTVGGYEPSEYTAGGLQPAPSDWMLKVDIASGTVAWQISGVFGWPVVAGDKLLVLSPSGLQVRSASSGALVWSWPPTSSGHIADQLIVVGKHAFISDGAATRAIDLDKQQQVWMDIVPGRLAISPNGILYIDGREGLVGVNLR